MSKSYFNIDIKWESTKNGEFPYQAMVDNHNWIIRVNDFPEEEIYTLIIDGEEVKNFDHWPSTWQR